MNNHCYNQFTTNCCNENRCCNTYRHNCCCPNYIPVPGPVGPAGEAATVTVGTTTTDPI